MAEGALVSGIPAVSYLGPAILLISAIFTAAYLLPISVSGFLPGINEGEQVIYHREKEYKSMLLPMAVLSVAAVYFGIFPNGLMHFVDAIIQSVF